jgi:hypothetical protein
MLIWRLRSAKERDQILEELDALLDRRILLQLYLKATSEKHSFWYVALLNEQDSMFYKNFEHKMLLIDKDGSQSQTTTSAGLHERSGASGASLLLLRALTLLWQRVSPQWARRQMGIVSCVRN